jgi:hypothetical protein
MSSFLENLRQDLHFAFRNLRKSPGFLAVVILSLALGIGANSTIFSVVDAAFYRPLPYPQPNQLVAIWDTEPGRPSFFSGYRSHQRLRRLNDGWHRCSTEHRHAKCHSKLFFDDGRQASAGSRLFPRGDAG